MKKEREIYHKLEQEIMGERQQQLQKKQRIAKLALLEKQTSDVVYFGLWQSVAQITSSIQTIKNRRYVSRRIY